MAGSGFVIDDFAKGYLYDDLRFVRRALVWKLDALAEYDTGGR